MAERKKPPIENLPFVAWEERVAAGQIHGQVGQINHSEDGEKIVCHLCGRAFRQLSRTHLDAHGIGSADDYRELLGLNRKQPLVSPQYSQTRREIVAQTGNVRHIIGKGEPFVGGEDRRRQVPRRRQWTYQVRQRGAGRRARGELPPSTSGLEPDQRRVNPWSGRINLFGKDYYFGKGAEGPVTITKVTDKEITVRGKLKGGTTRVRTLKRKR